MLRRLAGVICPCIIFLIYLLWNKALYSFIALSFLGLLDFSSDNGRPFSIYFFLSIILFMIQIIIAIKNRNDKE